MELETAILKIREAHTDGINYDITTEDIINKLQEWSQRCDFTIDSVNHNTIEVKFQSLPTNLKAFCQEIYNFCPDVIDQGYDCIPDMIEIAENMGESVNQDIQELVAGVDLEAEDCGLQLMEKDLPRIMKLTLWWD